MVLSLDQKVQAVQELHGALQMAPGRNGYASDWILAIMAEVAEIPRYRAVVHDIRATLKTKRAQHG